MELTMRRVALLACSVTLNVCLLLAAPLTQPVQAAQCQEDVNADLQACNTNCDQLYDYQSDDWFTCRGGCKDDWTAASMHAVCCNVDGGYWYCSPEPTYERYYQCDYTYTGNCYQ